MRKGAEIVVAAALLAAGCGRLRYEPSSDAGRDVFVPEGVDASLDAAAQPDAALDPDAPLAPCVRDADCASMSVCIASRCEPMACDTEIVVRTTAPSGPGSWLDAIASRCSGGELCITFDLPLSERGAEGFVLGAGEEVHLACAGTSILGGTQASRHGRTNTGFHSHPVGSSGTELRVDEVEIEIRDRIFLEGPNARVSDVAIDGLTVTSAASGSVIERSLVGASARFSTRLRADGQPVLVLDASGLDVRSVYVAAPDGVGGSGVVRFVSGGGVSVTDLDVHAGAGPSAAGVVEIEDLLGLTIVHASAVGRASFTSAFHAVSPTGLEISDSTADVEDAACQLEVVGGVGPALSGNVGNVCIR